MPGPQRMCYSRDQVQSPWPDKPLTPGTEVHDANKPLRSLLSLNDAGCYGEGTEPASRGRGDRTSITRVWPTSSTRSFHSLQVLLCISCGRGLAGLWGPKVCKTAGVCSQGACSAAPLLVGKSPKTTRGSTCPQITFSEFPGAGRLPQSAGFICTKFNYLNSTSSWRRGTLEKLQRLPPKDKKLFTLRPLCLFVSRDSSVFWVTATTMLPSYLISERTKLEGNTRPWRQVTLASHHKIIKSSEQTHVHVFLQGPKKKKKPQQFLNCLIKPLLIPYSKCLKTGRKNR